MMKKISLSLLICLFGIVSFSQEAINVEKFGSGNPILFLPGFTTPGAVWNETILGLNQEHEYHLVSYAGFNGLEPIGTPWYAPIREALVQYIKDENLSNLTVIGHSMGGNLATELASELPKHVTGLIIVDALPCMRAMMMPDVPAEALFYESPYNKQMLEMTDEKFDEFANMMASNMTNIKEKVPDIASWTITADRETYVYGYTDLLKIDLREQLKEISISTLVLGATFPTPEMAKQTLETQYENLPNKTIELASDSKHFIMFDQPEWLTGQIKEYLASNAQ